MRGESSHQSILVRFTRLPDGRTWAAEDWIRARRIVNGLDCAEKIAVYGRTFDAALLVAAC